MDVDGGQTRDFFENAVFETRLTAGNYRTRCLRIYFDILKKITPCPPPPGEGVTATCASPLYLPLLPYLFDILQVPNSIKVQVRTHRHIAMTIGPVCHLLTVATVLHIHVEPQQYLLHLRQLHLLHKLCIRGHSIVHGLVLSFCLLNSITLPEYPHP